MNTSTPFSPVAFATSIAPALAALTGSVWTASPYFAAERQYPHDPAKLVRSDGLTLIVGAAFKGRVEIGLSRPRDSSGVYHSLWASTGCQKVSDPSIGVASSKDAVTVAKDIVRRLLPDAERVHALALAANASADNYAQAVKRAEAARDEAAKALSGLGGYGYASAAGREVEFKVGVEPERALAFAALVRDFFKPSNS